MKEKSSTKRPLLLRVFVNVCAIFFLFLLVAVFLGPLGDSDAPNFVKETPEIVSTRSINLLLFSYSNDHEQQYPTGKSSTEVFQKLLDENYTSDPTIFYLPIPGKTPPLAGQKLKPENVCFDVTSGIEGDSSDLVPVVFLTGYRIAYEPAGTATLLPQPDLPFLRTWKQWWNDEKPLSVKAGIVVAYKSNSAVFLKLKPDSGGVVPHFISPDFKPDGKVYRQLTPEGPLPEK